MRVFAVLIALGASLVAMPAAAATSCNVVNEHGYWELRESGLESYGVYYLYAKSGPGGWDAVKLSLANGGGELRMLLNDTTLGPADSFQIRTEDGRLVSHC